MVVPSSIVTLPPSADNAISPVTSSVRVASLVIVSAVITKPSIVKSVVASQVVNLPAAWVVPPITVSSIEPPLISGEVNVLFVNVCVAVN